MKTSWRIFTILFFTLISNFSSLEAQTFQRLRAIINADPAYNMTIGFELFYAGLDATAVQSLLSSDPTLETTIYYGTTDHGTDTGMYSFSTTSVREIVSKEMYTVFMSLTNLNPETKYYFVLKSGTTVSQTYSFETLPNHNNARLAILAGGDSRNAIPTGIDPDQILDEAVIVAARQNANSMVKKLRAHAVFFGGDMTFADTDAEWHLWLDHWDLTITDGDNRLTPIIPARGNHEFIPTSVYDMFNTPNTDSYYGVRFCDDLLHLSTLNSEASISTQGTWLEGELASNACTYWKMAQYHRPIRAHETSKSYQDDQRAEWATRFDKYGVQLVCESDAHVAKYTHPIRVAATGENNGTYSEDEGFIRDDENGTTYIGEGGWGAEIRSTLTDYDWSIDKGTYNQVKWLFIDKDKIEIRNLLTDSAPSAPAKLEGDNKFDALNYEFMLWDANTVGKVLTITNATPPTKEVDLGENVELPASGSVVLDAGQDHNNEDYFSYLWNTGATTRTITATAIGTYQVTVTNRALCEKTDEVEVLFAAVLPVEWLDFSGVAEKNKSNRLNWVTGSEFNNAYFVVEASKDGKNFEAIGQRAGNGTIEERNSYTFLDKAPLAQTTYYRVRQVDLDGSENFSKIIEITQAQTTGIQIDRFAPNPVWADAKVAFTTTDESPLTYEIKDIKGRTILTKSYQPTIGQNEVFLSVESLTKGVHFLVIQQGKNTVTYRFIKQ